MAQQNEKMEKEGLDKLEKEVKKLRETGASEAKINAVYTQYEVDKKK